MSKSVLFNIHRQPHAVNKAMAPTKNERFSVRPFGPSFAEHLNKQTVYQRVYKSLESRKIKKLFRQIATKHRSVQQSGNDNYDGLYAKCQYAKRENDRKM